VPPLAIRVHRLDNVAIATAPEGLLRGELIPQGHKVALRDFAQGDAILRYGHVIGYAARAIREGMWVREELVDAPAPPPLDDLPLATAPPPPLPPLEGYTFDGYRNPDGSAGTKNILAIATTVQCVAPTVEYAVRRIKAEILPRFPNVAENAGDVRGQ
jgi:galactarate dehydratase